jgi:hypothetical protein
VLKKIYNPSRIVLATCIRGVFAHNNIEINDILKLFPLDVLLYFIYFCFRAHTNQYEKSISQRNIEDNVDVKYYLFINI